MNYTKNISNYLYEAIYPKRTIADEFQAAIAKGNADEISRLGKEYISTPLPNGELPLNYAIRQSQRASIQALLQLGADPFQYDDQHLNAIATAYYKDDHPLVLDLLHHVSVKENPEISKEQLEQTWNDYRKILDKHSPFAINNYDLAIFLSSTVLWSAKILPESAIHPHLLKLAQHGSLSQLFLNFNKHAVLFSLASLLGANAHLFSENLRFISTGVNAILTMHLAKTTIQQLHLLWRNAPLNYSKALVKSTVLSLPKVSTLYHQYQNFHQPKTISDPASSAELEDEQIPIETPVQETSKEQLNILSDQFIKKHCSDDPHSADCLTAQETVKAFKEMKILSDLGYRTNVKVCDIAIRKILCKIDDTKNCLKDPCTTENVLDSINVPSAIPGIVIPQAACTRDIWETTKTFPYLATCEVFYNGFDTHCQTIKHPLCENKTAAFLEVLHGGFKEEAITQDLQSTFISNSRAIRGLTTPFRIKGNYETNYTLLGKKGLSWEEFQTYLKALYTNFETNYENDSNTWD